MDEILHRIFSNELSEMKIFELGISLKYLPGTPFSILPTRIDFNLIMGK